MNTILYTMIAAVLAALALQFVITAATPCSAFNDQECSVYQAYAE